MPPAASMAQILWWTLGARLDSLKRHRHPERSIPHESRLISEVHNVAEAPPFQNQAPLSVWCCWDKRRVLTFPIHSGPCFRRIVRLHTALLGKKALYVCRSNERGHAGPTDHAPSFAAARQAQGRRATSATERMVRSMRGDS